MSDKAIKARFGAIIQAVSNRSDLFREPNIRAIADIFAQQDSQGQVLRDLSLPEGSEAFRKLIHPVAVKPGSDPADAQDFGAVRRQAADTYQFRRYPGSIALFRATERSPYTLFFKLDPTNGWAALAEGGVRVTDLPGSHTNLIDAAHARAAAEALLREIAD